MGSLNIDVQRYSKTLHNVSFSLFRADTCEIGFKVLKRANMT
jgi:hypothetical protein